MKRASLPAALKMGVAEMLAISKRLANLSLLVAFFAIAQALASIGAQERAIPWKMESLDAPPKWKRLERPKADGVQAITFEGLPFRGKPTRVFAWLGLPPLQAGQKAPAMVLIHGGGGTAFEEWVRLWVSRGYAAIAMDTCGQLPVGTYGDWVHDPQGGPPGWGGLDQVDWSPEDQWTYHAVADAILAHSLIRSLPEVDSERTGVTGISWGGYLTCIVAGVDRRFKLAVPVYGCGFYRDTIFANELAKLSPDHAQQWLDRWDPSAYLGEAEMPFLWVTGSNDFAYPMNALQESYRLPTGPRWLCIRLRMPHGHGGPGENPEEIRVFADSILKGGPPLPTITSEGRSETNAWVTFTAKVPILRAELNYTKDAGRWQDRKWESEPVQLESGRAMAALPEGTRVFYFNLVDERNCVVSTEHEVIPSSGLTKPSAAVSGVVQTQTWAILLGPELRVDPAIKAALEDLKSAGAKCHIQFTWQDDRSTPDSDCIMVGAPNRNAQSATLAHRLGLKDIRHPQGFEITPGEQNGHRVLLVAGGSVVGEVYGLYWIWDRLQVEGRLPTVPVRRAPVLENRLSPAWGRQGSDGATPEQMRNALRYGLNWVAGPAVLDLVPWTAEPERERNKENRRRTEELIRYAHSLHLNVFSFANEFTYHPSLLNEFGASLSPCDPKLWDAVGAKFRRLLTALPDLDGIELCNDDLSGFWDNYRVFDVLHGAPECEWPLEKRYRTFVETVQRIVANEFHKTYFQFTWSLAPDEQHNQPDVFQRIFTSEVPVTNLFLMPKITAADRWWFQPFNPTFNLTPHPTMVAFETMNYYETPAAHLFPTFAGPYYQAGLQYLLSKTNHNLRGCGYRAGPDPPGWDTESLTAYTLFRLAWDPQEDVQHILRDFCSIHFGAEAAEGMARIYQLSAPAYKYGLHIEPVSYGQFNSLLQIRVGAFPVEGFPELDGGKEHIDFLRNIYLRCKPWEEETLLYLDHGLAKARDMQQLYPQVSPKIADKELARAVGNALGMTRLLIQVNNDYVRTAFAYFHYRGEPNSQNRNLLQKASEKLVRARSEFRQAPGFGYQLFGIDQLLVNVKELLDDRASAEAKLAHAANEAELTRRILQEEAKYREILQQHAREAVKVLHFDGAIDGRDILTLQGSRWSIQHVQWDGPVVKSCEVLAPLPEAAGTVIPEDIESRPLHQFILEQPSRENGYQVRVYLYDAPAGTGINKFNLFYIPKTPRELGLSERSAP
jgi:dienelactone hydrolase